MFVLLSLSAPLWLCGSVLASAATDRPTEEGTSGPAVAQSQVEPAGGPPGGSEEALEYPLGRSFLPDFDAAGRPFKLVDLRYSVSDTNRTTHGFAARVRVRNWGFLAAAFEGERRGMTITTQRLELSAFGEDGVYDLSGSYRAPWLFLSTEARRRAPAEARGWLVRSSVSARVSADLEFTGWASGETRPLPRTTRVSDRFLRAAAVGFLWQRGGHFEAAGEVAFSRVRTTGGLEYKREGANVSMVAQMLGAEVGAGALVERSHGRFPRQESEGTVGARVPIGARLLVDGEARARFEHGASKRSHQYYGALTWFGRRFTLPRSGEAARQAVALARRGTAMGLNERRVFGGEEWRAQRERLSLSQRREELRDEMNALYRAQVAERALPLLGVEVIDGADALPGVAAQTVRAFVGVPWPPAWPWRESEAAVPFLRLDLERRRERIGSGLEAIAHGVSLTTALNREMDLVLRWSRSDPTPLDMVRGLGEQRTIELSYVYAFGR